MEITRFQNEREKYFYDLLCYWLVTNQNENMYGRIINKMRFVLGFDEESLKRIQPIYKL